MTGFLLDAQLPPALARWIVDMGFEAAHVGDIALQGASDRQIWEWARNQNCVIVTKDSDFVTLAELAPNGPTVVWLRFPNMRRRYLLAAFVGAWPRIVAALERGETLIEIS